METFVADGKNARLQRRGHGTQLLYLHSGFGEVGALPFFDHLAEAGFEVFAPELCGFGSSDPAPEWKRIEDVVFHLRFTLDTLGLTRPVVVGSSLGGWLAAELAVWFPERVASLVLLDAFGLKVPGAPIFEIFGSSHREVWKRALSGEGDMLAHLAPAIESDEDPDAVRLHLFHAMEATARIGWNPYLHDPKLAGRLGLVGAPTLIVWGADDGIVPVAHGEAYASAIPGARLEILQSCAHLPALECPEKVAGLVASFSKIRP